MPTSNTSPDLSADARPKFYLRDYQPYPFVLPQVELEFDLDPVATRVRACLHFEPHGVGADLVLDGQEMELLSLRLNGQLLAADAYRLLPAQLIILAAHLPQEPFTLETEVLINPSANTALEGLYMSNGMYCTQCEAEGFRKITYFPDRPDVMARYRVRINSDQPVMLSNGNCLSTAPVVWEDPWPKPTYLFALVAGDLLCVEDHFSTRSGREVALRIYVRPGDEGKCDYAMDALKRAMAWDEAVYGRDYDLDLFMIVAVDDFNMGAMENKGLNIFNSKYVLASPETATDRDYEFIEGIIAHEYFHNWTGNRITCRDWFQLCLKEGLTVFRDQQFSADVRDAGVKRIEDVVRLRARQFREDAGPLAHPVRPEAYEEINNFYTATVYEKGAELIRMLKLLVGEAGYSAALDLYFARHDGQACTIEDWLAVFEDATGRDLSGFARWYHQSGTPHLEVQERYEGGVYTLHMRQTTRPTADQPQKHPLVLPISYAFLDAEGQEQEAGLFVMEGQEAVLTHRAEARPVVSLLRDFSAPVTLSFARPDADYAHLLTHDTNPFAKWEAGRNLAIKTFCEALQQREQPGSLWAHSMAAALQDEALDPAFRAQLLALPSEDELAQILHQSGQTPDPDEISATRKSLKKGLAETLGADLEAMIKELKGDDPQDLDARAASRRALLLALYALDALRAGGAERLEAAYFEAPTMTLQSGLLTPLIAQGAASAALADFYAKWAENRLVMDKYFTMIAAYSPKENALAAAEALRAHPLFELRHPNRARALIGGFTANHQAFHAKDGSGYRFVAQILGELDALNPQTAARLATSFDSIARYDSTRQSAARAAITILMTRADISCDMREILSKICH